MKVSRLFILMLIVFSFACSKDEEESSTPTVKYGTVSGIVTNSSNAEAIGGATVTLFSADNNQAIALDTTDADGSYTLKGIYGNYFLKINAQGFESVPPRGFSAVSFSLSASPVTKDFALQPSDQTDLGSIEGQVISGSTGMFGAMVVASNGVNAYSAISDANGNYMIFNIPAGTYSVKAWLVGFNSTDVSGNVTASTKTTDVNIGLSSGASGSVSGAITFLATQNKEVDVSLTHPETGETVPGLFTKTSNGTYSIASVPSGTYLARASFANDGIVMDPDWIIKNGEPFVTVSSGAITRDFSVTGAVTLNSPTNASTNTEPLEISSTTPTFTWTSYSSTSDYVIEVTNSNGVVIWGGFSSNWTVKNIVIPSSQTSIDFNSDGNATELLQPGEIYRWRIYASKDAGGGSSWNLISSSEDQQGLIMIAN